MNPLMFERAADRLMRSLVVVDSGCIISSLLPGQNGYSEIRVQQDKRVIRFSVHRLIWEICYGPIPDNLTIDHICRTKRCCNLDHLRLLTLSENVRAGNLGVNHHARKTECIRGHAFSEENTRRNANGSRTCRQCVKLRNMQRFRSRPVAV